MSNPFQPAVKAQLKARVALDGPTGAGKTWTALSMAEELAAGGRIAVADTERGKAKLYAHKFAFDHMSFEPPYDVNRLCEVLLAAQSNEYAVIVIDSMTHFWTGEGGVLDEVDAAAARSQGNKFVGWNHGTPLQRKMVDTILGLDAHVIVTMRSKMEYVQEKDERGKTTIRKVGMQPVQREGLEYEFDVIGDLDLDHRMLITKSRVEPLADQLIQPHDEKKAARVLLDFLNDGEPPPPMATAEDRGAFVEQIKTIEIATVKAEMIAWWREMGYTNDTPMSLPELAAAREHLADLLIEAAQGDDFAEIDGSEDASPLAQAASRVPEPSSALAGEPYGEVGDGDTASSERSEEPEIGSNGNAAASSPATNEKPKCARCGSTQAGLDAQDDGTYLCTIRASCSARAQLAGVGGKAAE